MASKVAEQKKTPIEKKETTKVKKVSNVTKTVKPVEKKTSVVAQKPKTVVHASVKVDVLGIDGKSAGKMDLPGDLFGEKVNKTLIAQAVRVYLTNQRQGNASTKTRGEVDGSSKKIYRQKGTGRARHGTLRAPIFVKGGIVFGPKPRDYNLSMPQKMKNKALVSALSAKAEAKQVTVLTGLAGIDTKTKVFATMLQKTGLQEKKQGILFVISKELQNARRAGNNIPGVTFANVAQVNVYELMAAKKVVFDKTIIDLLAKRIGGDKK